MSPPRLILDHVLDHAERHPDRVYLTQPLGGGRVADYTWAQVLDQARRMAAHLQQRGFEPGARIAILSKNCAHFIMAELAIWMAGGTTVAIFPTETADTVRFVLEHSDASLLFVGKLDTWPQQQPGVPAGLPCIALPLAPPTDFETWDAITARTAPLPGRPRARAEDLAMIIYTSGSTGQPKGVMINFGAVIARRRGHRAPTSASAWARPRAACCPTCRWRTATSAPGSSAASLLDGNTHVFFAESLDTFLQDLQRARPTLFLSVPRLWLEIPAGRVQQDAAGQAGPRCSASRSSAASSARKVLKGLGLDQVRQAGSASAPIPAELIRWYRRLGLELFEGYAMTEDFAYLAHLQRAVRRAGLGGRAVARRARCGWTTAARS